LSLIGNVVGISFGSTYIRQHF